MMTTGKRRTQDRITIVYWGSGATGKTENLNSIYNQLPVDNKGEIRSVTINDWDRLTYFDFVMPEIGTIHEDIATFRLQCIHRWGYSAKSRQDVLMGADAAVFVADSLSVRLQEHVNALKEFTQNLCKFRPSLDTFPWVIQYTKRDFSKHGILSIPELQLQLNPYHVPYFEANPAKGIGVFETLKAILHLAVRKVGT